MKFFTGHIGSLLDSRALTGFIKKRSGRGTDSDERYL